MFADTLSWNLDSLLSKKILALGSQYQAGLKSHHAQFSPLETPSCYEAGAQTIQYAAEGFIEATATKITDDTGAASVGFENLDGLGPSWGRIEEILGALWFGGNTGQIATKASWELLLYHWVAVWKVHADWIENSQFIFDFENAEIKPEPYSVQLKLNLAAFAEEGEGSLKNLEVNGIGWRFKAKMSATAGKAVNMV